MFARRRAPGTHFSKPRAKSRFRGPDCQLIILTFGRAREKPDNASCARRTPGRPRALGSPTDPVASVRRTPSRSPRALERGVLADFPPGTPRVSAASSPR